MDRTSNMKLYPSTDPSIIKGVVNASNGDTFLIPYGVLVDCMVSSQDDNNAIVSADTSGSKVILGCINDGGTVIGADFDIVFEAIIRSQ